MKSDDTVRFMQTSPVWLETLDMADLKIVLREYGYLIHRFTQFIALVIGHAEDAEVRRLLLPNLVDEIGDDQRNLAHVKLFERCAISCDLHMDSTNVSPATKDIEAWFFTVFDSADTLRSLAVLGPGTEEIAQNFLVPLERGLTRAFNSVDVSYFDVHRPTIETMHIGDIRRAIEILRDKVSEPERLGFDALIEAHTRSALAMHSRFWENVRHLVRIKGENA